jgi:dCTP deaminase
MTLLSDASIIERCVHIDQGEHKFIPKSPEETMIYPFIMRQINSRDLSMVSDKIEGIHKISEKIISFGLSSYGYDVRLSREFKVFRASASTFPLIVDPKIPQKEYFQDIEADNLIIPPHSYVLGKTMEYIRVPRDLTIIAIGKSTYARCGIIINVTPLESGWHGEVTLEIANTTPLPARIYAGEGIAQFLFIQGDREPLISYADRSGKYQGQTGVTPAKI